MIAHAERSFDLGLDEIAAAMAQLEAGACPPFGRTAHAQLRVIDEDLAILDEAGYRADVDAARRERIAELVRRLRAIERVHELDPRRHA